MIFLLVIIFFKINFVGRIGYLVKDKILPFRKKIRDVVKKICLKEFETKDAILLKGQTYLFPCLSINLPNRTRASLSPKSSIGRVDLMVRAIHDDCGLYDTIDKDAKIGELWIEATPRSFNIKIHEGICLTQMMIFQTLPSRLKRPETTKSLTESQTVVYSKLVNKPVMKYFHKDSLVLSLEVYLFSLVYSLAFSVTCWL